VAAHEFKHDRSGHQWRTWHISDRPVRPQLDATMATGSAHLMTLMDSGQLLQRQPQCPYLAAYHAARNLDILRAYMVCGGPAPVSVVIDGQRSPIVQLVPYSARAEASSLAEMIRGQHQTLILCDLAVAAALITLGFPLESVCSNGALLMGHTPWFGPASSPPPDAEEQSASVTCEGLTFRTAYAAVRAIQDQSARAQRQLIADGIDDPPLQSPLEPAHLLHWAAAGTLRREALRAVEQQLGHDASSLRSHIMQGRSQRAGHAVIATKDEFEANEDTIIKHLRRFS